MSERTMGEVLKERGSTHGDFTLNSRVSQVIKKSIREADAWACVAAHDRRGLGTMHLEALDMIAHKIGRIAVGDPNFEDHWVDIAGYAQLVVDRLRVECKAPTIPETSENVRFPAKSG